MDMKRDIWREIAVYALLFAAGYLPGLLLLPSVFVTGNRDIAAWLRYLANTLLLSAWPCIGFLALAVRRSRLFGSIAAVLLALTVLIPALPDIPVYWRLGLAGYPSYLLKLLSGVFPVIVCFGAAMLCRLVRRDLTAFLLSLAAPACCSLLALIPGLGTETTGYGYFVPLLFEIGFALLSYPIFFLLKRLLLRQGQQI